MARSVNPEDSVPFQLFGDFKMAWQLLEFLETLLYGKKWLVCEIFFVVVEMF